MSLTTDFTGTYDYEREEAKLIARSYCQDLECGYYENIDQYQQDIIKERNHWLKILDTNGMSDFSDEFNKLTVEKCKAVFGKEVYL